MSIKETPNGKWFVAWEGDIPIECGFAQIQEIAGRTVKRYDDYDPDIVRRVNDRDLQKSKTNREAATKAKDTAKVKLLALGLTDEEIKALMGR